MRIDICCRCYCCSFSLLSFDFSNFQSIKFEYNLTWRAYKIIVCCLIAYVEVSRIFPVLFRPSASSLQLVTIQREQMDTGGEKQAQQLDGQFSKPVVLIVANNTSEQQPEYSPCSLLGARFVQSVNHFISLCSSVVLCCNLQQTTKRAIADDSNAQIC